MGVAEQIERRLESLELPGAVEEKDGVIVITAIVMSDEEHRAILEVAEELAPPGTEIEDNIETEGILAADIGDLEVSSPAFAPDEPTQRDSSEEGLDAAADFTEQRLLKNPLAASGPSDNIEDDHVSEGDVSYVPPTDPTRTRDGEVLGGFAITSVDDVGIERSSDGTIGDSAIEDAVRRELKEDAATTALEIEVEAREGIVHLRGRVQDIVDVESAEEVASRVPGVREVHEYLEVETT